MTGILDSLVILLIRIVSAFPSLHNRRAFLPLYCKWLECHLLQQFEPILGNTILLFSVHPVTDSLKWQVTFTASTTCFTIASTNWGCCNKQTLPNFLVTFLAGQPILISMICMHPLSTLTRAACAINSGSEPCNFEPNVYPIRLDGFILSAISLGVTTLSITR